jgi:hypothetical protein
MATQTVTPLAYHQVRQLAESALSMATGPASFVFNGDGMEFVPPEMSPPEQGVLVQTSNPSKRPRLGYMTLQLPPATAGGAPPSLDTVMYHADAVFWSEAAVKKFVNPYCASCGGYYATEALTNLRLAWNGVAQDARVFALLHVTWDTPPVPEHMEPLWVAFASADGTTSALPLGAYIQRHQPVLQGDAGLQPGVAYVRPLPGPADAGYPDYNALRGVAEWSASLTQQPMYFTFDAASGQFRGPSATLPPVVGSQIAIPVHNPTVPRDRPSPVGAWIQPPGDGAPMDLSPMADAVFWSTGAIEQFMLPYYASVDGFSGLANLQAIQAAWLGDIPGAGGGDDGDGPPVIMSDPMAEEVYALVHLPRSAWVSAEEAPSEASITLTETGLVHRDAQSGHTRLSSAASFIAARRKAR